MMSVHGIRSRQPVVGDTIGWWWDSYELAMDASSILEMYRFQKKNNYALQNFYRELKRRKDIFNLILTFALAEET